LSHKIITMEWINIKTRMPELVEKGDKNFKFQSSARLLVYDEGYQSIKMGIFVKCKDWERWKVADGDEIYFLNKVSHWMSLPNKPTEI